MVANVTDPVELTTITYSQQIDKIWGSIGESIRRLVNFILLVLQFSRQIEEHYFVE